jgi:hypothetical protein
MNQTRRLNEVQLIDKRVVVSAVAVTSGITITKRHAMIVVHKHCLEISGGESPEKPDGPLTIGRFAGDWEGGLWVEWYHISKEHARRR